MLKLKNQKGFTLIELMIVVAIIGILAAIAVPNFIAYRDKARFSTAIATGESIRAALAGYAATSAGNLYPLSASGTAGTDKIGVWADLQTIALLNGVTLPAEATVAITADSLSYLAVIPGAGSVNGIDGNDYSLTYTSTDDGLSLITVSPAGITATYGTTG